jgi:DNA replication and repair protein RecF
MIRFGAAAGRVALAGDLGPGAFETDVILTRGDSRSVRLNGEQLDSSERLRQELTTLVFTPDRLAVVKGAPATRRAYVDRVVARLFPARARVATDYSATVGQRNAALRRIRAGHSTRDALVPWTERTAALAEELVHARGDALATLSGPFCEAAAGLGLAEATLAYEGDAPSVADLEARLETDVERGVTGTGPHLHDVRIEAGGRDLRVFGSQGEQRVAVLSLVLAEAASLRSRGGVSPLVLLDDVLSELDGDRRTALSAMIAEGGQTVVTATSTAALPGEPALTLSVMPGDVR